MGPLGSRGGCAALDVRNINKSHLLLPSPQVLWFWLHTASSDALRLLLLLREAALDKKVPTSLRLLPLICLGTFPGHIWLHVSCVSLWFVQDLPMETSCVGKNKMRLAKRLTSKTEC